MIRSLTWVVITAAVLLSCLSASAQPIDPSSPAFAQGHADRTAVEQWVASLQGEQLRGAKFWATYRSQRPTPSCLDPTGRSQGEFTVGCTAAQQRLALIDVRRKSEPSYRAGFSAPPDDAVSPHPLADAVTRCRGEATPMVRLGCYDAIASSGGVAFPPPPAAPASASAPASVPAVTASVSPKLSEPIISADPPQKSSTYPVIYAADNGPFAVWKDEASAQIGGALIRSGANKDDPFSMLRYVSCILTREHRVTILDGFRNNGFLLVRVTEGADAGCEGVVPMWQMRIHD